MSYTQKPIPSSVLIFGGGRHIGRPLAQMLTREAPDIRLRLVSRDSAVRADLQAAFPRAEVVHADWFDRQSLERATAGIEGIFLLTPSGTDETPAMTNLVEALHNVRAQPHIIRLLGMMPEYNPRNIPAWLKERRLGLPVQHPIAKRILDDSGLPVTYLNSNATFMDNFSRFMAPPVRNRRILVWPERLIPYIDPIEIAEVSVRLFLSTDQRHIGQFHTINNGQDILRYGEVAQMLSEILGEKITHDPTQEAFFSEYAFLGTPLLHYLWNFFSYEEQNEIAMSCNDWVERIIGRRPISVREWLIRNRAVFQRQP